MFGTALGEETFLGSSRASFELVKCLAVVSLLARRSYLAELVMAPYSLFALPLGLPSLTAVLQFVNEVPPWFIPAFFVDNSRDQAGLVLAKLVVSVEALAYLVQSSLHSLLSCMMSKQFVRHYLLSQVWGMISFEVLHDRTVVRTLVMYRCCRLLRTPAVCRQLLDSLLTCSLESSLAKAGQQLLLVTLACTTCP